MYYYRVFGLPIVSEIELPSLLAGSKPDTNADVISVSLGKADAPFKKEPLLDRGWYKFNNGEFCYHLPGQVRFFVKNGNEIIIEPLCKDHNAVLLYFYSNAITAALMQRGLTPFHVSGIKDHSGKVWLFAAPSKVGKSTTALMLKERGYELFTDDTALLEIIDGKSMAVASYPMVRVWSQTLKKQKTFEGYEAYQMREGIDKFGMHFHKEFSHIPVEIRGIIFLNNSTDDLKIEEIAAVKAFRLMRQNIYRNNWVSKMRLESEIYALIASILVNIPTFIAYRPKDEQSFDEFADMIDDHIQQFL